MSRILKTASPYPNTEARFVQLQNDVPKHDTNNGKQRAHKAPVSPSSKRPSETSTISFLHLGESFITAPNHYQLLFHTESQCLLFQMVSRSSATCSQFEPVYEPEPNIENRFSYVRFRFGFSSGPSQTVLVRVRWKQSMNRTEPNRGITISGTSI